MKQQQQTPFTYTALRECALKYIDDIEFQIIEGQQDIYEACSFYIADMESNEDIKLLKGFFNFKT